MDKLKKEKEYFAVITRNVIVKLCFDDIYYFESQGRKILVHSKENTISYNGSLVKLKDQLDERFYACHGSFIVNLSKVRKLEKTILELENGISVPVSQRRKGQTAKLLRAYLKKHFPCNLDGVIV